jgi:hypothetical protein
MSASRQSTKGAGTEKKTAGRRNLAASVNSLAISSAGGAPSTVGDIPRLINAMDRYASEHSGFESSTVGSIVQSEMAAATDINHAALVPLRHKIFTFDVALKWGFLLSNIAPRILSEDGGSLPASFDLLRYNAELVTIYDLAVESGVWEYCEEEEDDEDDAEDLDE